MVHVDRFFFDGICRGDLFFSYPLLSIVIFCCLLFSFNGSKVESRCRSLFEIKCSHPGALFTELLSKSSHYPPPHLTSEGVAGTGLILHPITSTKKVKKRIGLICLQFLPFRSQPYSEGI